MLRNRIYYGLKPFVPQSLRTAIRRSLALRLRKRIADVWPIMPGSERPPENWPGWPEGKKFAFVLTHDVESKVGLGKCRSLMQLERELGFRSSFNFVPEGDYKVPAKLREELTACGFEVGIHDLKHDGHLFGSHRRFKRRAVRINSYAREWGASGFRSGFMLRNLDWLHDLDVQYDASTFDTDPFEPQPDGGHTIFPIWVPRPNGSSINGQEPGSNSSSRYAGQYWHALPREVAAYVKAKQPAANANDQASTGGRPDTRLTGAGAILSVNGGNGRNLYRRRFQPAGRVVMLVENYFPQDTRVRNEALLLKSAGYELAVVCYRKPDQPRREKLDGINVYRISRFELFRKTPSGESSRLSLFWLRFRSLVGYLVEYFYFTTACFIHCARIFIKSGFDVIHAHNPPDTLFLVALPFKLLGKKFVFDHHDLCPELYQSRYSAEPGVYTSLLRAFEWCSLKLADVTVATNNSYKEIEIERGGVRPDRIFIVRNGPSSERMTSRAPSGRLRRLNKTILCYVGSLNPQDGVDYLLRALDRLKNDLQRHDFYCVIIGDGDSLRDLQRLAGQLRLNGCVELTGFIPDKELLENLAAADICVDPDPASPLNNVSTWIKIMEYMAYGKPIVSFDLKETRFSAQDAALFVPPNDELAFARAIAVLMDDPELRQKLGRFGRERVERELQWSVTGQNLVAAYESLFPETKRHLPPSRPRQAAVAARN